MCGQDPTPLTGGADAPQLPLRVVGKVGFAASLSSLLCKLQPPSSALRRPHRRVAAGFSGGPMVQWTEARPPARYLHVPSALRPKTAAGGRGKRSCTGFGLRGGGPSRRALPCHANLPRPKAPIARRHRPPVAAGPLRADRARSRSRNFALPRRKGVCVSGLLRNPV
jgi:hypothetical protein